MVRKSSKVSTEELLSQHSLVLTAKKDYKRARENLHEAENRMTVLVNRASAITVKRFTVESLKLGERV